jgi:hypothetical protein
MQMSDNPFFLAFVILHFFGGGRGEAVDKVCGSMGLAAPAHL